MITALRNKWLWCPQIIRLADVWKTCNKIRAAAFRVGLNLWDWYRPLDPEGNSLISGTVRPVTMVKGGYEN